jgi:rhodanese-related sulfurtransferase
MMMDFFRSLFGGSAGTVITPEQYQQDFKQAKKPHTLIDVRTPEEFNGGHIPGAINIDVQVLEQRMKEIPQDKAVVLYCRSGNRSSTAAGMLQRAGYTDVFDLGGIGAWARAGLPIK